MPEYRFGISLLSKDRFTEAYNEEVMIDKLTGEVLVKAPTGDTISYNYNSRLKSHIVETRAIANNLSVYGDIISIEFDNINAPFTMEFDRDYIVNDLVIPYNNCKNVLFNADIDAITINTSGISYERNNMLLELTLAAVFNDNTMSADITIKESIEHLNHKKINLLDGDTVIIPDDKAISGIVLKSFKIMNSVVNHSGEIVESDDIIRPIFNSLFAVIHV